MPLPADCKQEGAQRHRVPSLEPCRCRTANLRNDCASYGPWPTPLPAGSDSGSSALLFSWFLCTYMRKQLPLRAGFEGATWLEWQGCLVCLRGLAASAYAARAQPLNRFCLVALEARLLCFLLGHLRALECWHLVAVSKAQCKHGGCAGER